MMRSRMMAAVAAAMAMPGVAVAGVSNMAHQASALLGGDETGTSSPRPPSYRPRVRMNGLLRGVGGAAAKRMARKRRNRLRAKGHHRKAVR